MCVCVRVCVHACVCFVVVTAANVCNFTARPEVLYTDYIMGKKQTNFLSHLSSLK